MTGNIAFLGFAGAGAPGFSLSASLSALAGFLLGALAGGRAVVAALAAVAMGARTPPYAGSQCRTWPLRC